MFKAVLYTRLLPVFRERDAANDDAKQLESTLAQACDLAIQRVPIVSDQKATYWWSDEIATLRKIIFARRRIHQS